MALREVNLIPSEILSRRQLRRHLCFWSFWLLLSLLVISGSYLFQTHVILGKKRTLASLSNIDTDLGIRIGRIEEIQKELDDLHKKRAVLQAIVRNQPYSRVLLRLADIMNENTWLTSLSIDDSRETEGNTNLEMVGFSYSNEDLGDFLSQLSNEIVFQDVVLKFANETEGPRTRGQKDSPIKIIYFQLMCHLSGV